jgi:hypothetical protein
MEKKPSARRAHAVHRYREKNEAEQVAYDPYASFRQVDKNARAWDSYALPISALEQVCPWERS